MLVSVAQQSESAICIHMSPYLLPLEPPSHPPCATLGHRKALSLSPCAMLLLPTSQLFYIRYCIHVNATLTLPQLRPPTPCHQVHSLCLPLYSCLATRFISFEGEVKSKYRWSDIYHVLGTCVFSSSSHDNPERYLFLFPWLLVIGSWGLEKLSNVWLSSQWCSWDFNPGLSDP